MRPAAKSGDGSQGRLRAQIVCVTQQVKAGAQNAGQSAPVPVTTARHSLGPPGRSDAKLGGQSTDQGPDVRPVARHRRGCMEWYIYTTAQRAMESHGLSLNGAHGQGSGWRPMTVLSG